MDGTWTIFHIVAALAYIGEKSRGIFFSSWDSGWDETNYLGRDRDREIRLMKFHYETETEKKWMLIF